MKVDNNIPIPKDNNGRPAKYPWATLRIGDSFFINKAKYSPYSLLRSYNKNKAKTPIQITTKREGKGVRVWRIA